MRSTSSVKQYARQMRAGFRAIFEWSKSELNWVVVRVLGKVEISFTNYFDKPVKKALTTNMGAVEYAPRLREGSFIKQRSLKINQAIRVGADWDDFTQESFGFLRNYQVSKQREFMYICTIYSSF